MPELALAARVGDTIAHSPLAGIALAGIAVGLVVGAVLVGLTIATGGADVLVGGAIFAEGASVLATVGMVALAIGDFLGLLSTWCTVTGLLYTAGKKLGVMFSASMPTGKITAGASTVFIGEGVPAAARYQDPIECQEPMTTYVGATMVGNVICPGVGGLIAAAIVYRNSAHAGATIAQGSKTVLTEGKSQSRVGDKTSCGGTISTGCDSVIVGGPPNQEVSALAELPGAVVYVMDWVDNVGVWAGMLSGISGLFKRSGTVFEKVMEFGLAGTDVGLWITQKVLERNGDEDAAKRVENFRALYETGLMLRLGKKGIGKAGGAKEAEEEFISIFHAVE